MEKKNEKFIRIIIDPTFVSSLKSRIRYTKLHIFEYTLKVGLINACKIVNNAIVDYLNYIWKNFQINDSSNRCRRFYRKRIGR